MISQRVCVVFVHHSKMLHLIDTQAEPDDRIDKELDKLSVKRSENPYLQGTKLGTVAKKGFPGK